MAAPSTVFSLTDATPVAKTILTAVQMMGKKIPVYSPEKCHNDSKGSHNDSKRDHSSPDNYLDIHLHTMKMVQGIDLDVASDRWLEHDWLWYSGSEFVGIFSPASILYDARPYIEVPERGYIYKSWLTYFVYNLCIRVDLKNLTFAAIWAN